MVKFLFFLALVFAPAALAATVTVDCQGMTYSNLMVWMSNQDRPPFEAVIISSPFKAFDKTLSALDGPVYDFQDAGSRFQRGGVETFLGDETALRALALSLSRKNISLYARVDLFRQSEGYNRGGWEPGDFLPDYRRYLKKLYVDVRRASTRGKLANIIGQMRRLPVQKWLVDVRGLPSEIRGEAVAFLAGNLGASAIILAGPEEESGRTARIADYRKLSAEIFNPYQPDFKLLEKWRPETGPFHYIESDDVWVNNTAAVALLLLQRCRVIVSRKFLNRFHVELFDFLKTMNGPGRQILSPEKMIFWTPEKMIAFNFTDQFAVWDLKRLWNRPGFYKSPVSGSTLSVGRQEMTLFMMPKSIAFWDQK